MCYPNHEDFKNLFLSFSFKSLSYCELRLSFQKIKKRLIFHDMTFSLLTVAVVFTLLVLSVWKLDLHIVVFSDLLYARALWPHYGAVELLRDHTLHGDLRILQI